MKLSVTLAIALVTLAVASSVKGESKRREHHVPIPHPTKEYISGFKSAYAEKKSRESHQHKGYPHDDKHNHKIKHPIETPPHEGHMQVDLRSPKNSKHIRGHDAWHKKDLHLQDLSFDSSKVHHPKAGHSWPHHSDPLQKHEATHHKALKTEDHTHHGHKSSSEKTHHHPVAAARTMTKSYHHSDAEASSHVPQHFDNKKSHKGEQKNWAKIKKQKKATEKKQKQHRKKQFKGELHKLW